MIIDIVDHQVYAKERTNTIDVLFFMIWGIAQVKDVTKCDKNYLFCVFSLHYLYNQRLIKSNS